MLKAKFKEVFLAVLPITLIVLFLNFTIAPLETPVLLRFLVGAVLIVVGLVLFLIGVDLGVTPLGSLSGSAIARSNKLWIVIVAGLILGFFISIAEPGLIVLANQVDSVTGGVLPGMLIVIVVSVGMALMLAFGFVRIVFNWPLHRTLWIFYALTALLAIFASPEFLAISFDASGATTGVLAVPFILALASGVANLKRDAEASEEDSFGLVAITSVGAIIGVLLIQVFSNVTEFHGNIEVYVTESVSVIKPFFGILPDMLVEGIISLSPLVVLLIVLQKIAFKLQKRNFARIWYH